MSIVPIGRTRWPSARGSRAAFVRRFGAARTDLLHHALNRGDPAADALAAIDGRRGIVVRRQLAVGLRVGLASLDEPDAAVVRLLEESESMPDHVDERLVASGPPGWYAVPRPLHLASMSAGALLGLYASPSIAGVLASTGRLLCNTEHRLRDTARWLSTSTLPGSLAIGRAGYVATVEVRLLHAHMRRTARRRGHDERAFGVAINQADLALTWLGFTLTSMRAEASLGFELSASEIAGNYRYWQRQAQLLGIDAALVADIEDHDGAERLETMLRTTAGEPSPASAPLTERTLSVAADELERMLAAPAGTGDIALRALAERFHGGRCPHGAGNSRGPDDAPAIAGAVGDVRPRAFGAGKGATLAPLLTPLAAAARVHRALSRLDAPRWRARCADRAGEALDLLSAAANDEPSAYERLAHALDASARAGACDASAAAGTSPVCGRDALAEAA